jgi:hypothetical protein
MKVIILYSLFALTCVSASVGDLVKGVAAKILTSADFTSGSCSSRYPIFPMKFKIELFVGYKWYTCPPGSGISSNSTGYPNCCPGKADWYCPDVAKNGCMTGGKGCTTCASSSYPYACSNSQGSWCCPASAPVCSTTVGYCLQQTCSCGGCYPDPCSFMSCSGSECSSCCNAYSLVCPGPQTCVGGPLGVQTYPASSQCSP